MPGFSLPFSPPIAPFKQLTAGKNAALFNFAPLWQPYRPGGGRRLQKRLNNIVREKPEKKILERVTCLILRRIICKHTRQTSKCCFMTELDYNECVKLYADNVYRFIVKNLRHPEDAQDVVQTAFEKLWVNRQQVEAAKAKSYLFAIAYHQMIDHLRKVKRINYKEELPETAMGTENQPSSYLKKTLEEALATLTETQRNLVMLKDYEGYNYAEIGEIMGLNESQVKVYLHRARLHLRNYLVRMENVV